MEDFRPPVAMKGISRKEKTTWCLEKVEGRKFLPFDKAGEISIFED